MKETWEAVGERFKTYNLGKYSKQSAKDSQTWIAQRFKQPSP
jgi:hypothetical protein